MGKQRKLMRSSIKALQGAITRFRPTLGGPLCIQPVTDTHSFREMFNSVYHTLPSSSSSSLLCHHHNKQHESLIDISIPPLPNEEQEEEEEAVTSSNMAASASASSCLSSSSCSSFVTATGEAESEAFQIGTISSKRFFFSPCNTKSIIREATESKEGLKDIRIAETGEEITGEDDDATGDLLVEEGKNSVMMIPIAMASLDPHGDFRRSMEEMVEARGLTSLRDWSGLQDLLHCYLRLNEKKTHKFIMLAFVDLLLHLTISQQDDDDKSKATGSSSSSSHHYHHI